jgi:hypothetical protein
MQAIGYLVLFSVHGTSKPVRMELERARALFDDLGLDPNHIPDKLHPFFAFQAASSSTTVDYSNKDWDFQLRAQVSRRGDEFEDRHVIRHGVSRRTRRPQPAFLMSVKFFHGEKGRAPEVRRTVAAELLDASNQVIGDLATEDRRAANEWWAAFNNQYEELQTHLAADQLRTVIRDSILDSDGILITARSGMYFVPAEYNDTMIALREFVEQISEECRLHLIPVFKDPNTLKLIADAWQDSAETKGQRILSEIQRITVKMRTQRTTRVKLETVTKYRVALEDYQVRIAYYRELTGVPTPAGVAAIARTIDEEVAYMQTRMPKGPK